MKLIGITGGIGSGKSIICNVFESLNVPVFYADTEAKKLYTDTSVRDQLINWYGESIIFEGSIDLKKLASIVFTDKSQLIRLNHFIHPLVGKLFLKWTKQYTNRPYLIEEAALLIESNTYKMLDKTILVYAPLEMRIQRVMNRDRVTREAVLLRVANQMDDEEKKKLVDAIIFNDEKQLVLPQILELHKQLSQ